MKKHTIVFKKVDILCYRCLLNIVNALSPIEGIQEFNVNLENKRVKIIYTDEKYTRKKFINIINESIIRGKVTEEFYF